MFQLVLKPLHKTNSTYYNHTKADISGVYQSFATISSDYFDNINNVNITFEQFYIKLYEIINFHVNKQLQPLTGT